MKPPTASSPTIKAFVIGVLVIVLLVPLAMLEGLVRERATLRDQAHERVARSWGDTLVTGGPVLVVPTEARDERPGITSNTSSDVFALPLDVAIEIDVRQEPSRYIGLYRVPVFMADVSIAGRFDIEAARRDLEARFPDQRFLWQSARVRIPLADLKGLRSIAAARFGPSAVTLAPSGPVPFSGLEAALPVALEQEGPPMDFELHFSIACSREIAIHPTGSTTRVSMRSDWPDPSFGGAYLPGSRSITAAGFKATWQVLELNRSYGAIVSAADASPSSLAESAFGVGFHAPVDVYLRGERAVKYALVFIALTFMTIFAWEHVNGPALHPLHYLLVGLALSVFYLLLIALSEHITFAYAYWIATLAQVVLIGTYLAGVLEDRRRGTVAAGMLAVLYGVLYALVISEDYALLMGAFVLFLVLAIVMVTTRHVDWYAMAARRSPRTTIDGSGSG